MAALNRNGIVCGSLDGITLDEMDIRPDERGDLSMFIRGAKVHWIDLPMDCEEIINLAQAIYDREFTFSR